MLRDVPERNAGCEHRVLESMPIAHANSLAVQLRTGAARGGELFVAHRVDDHRVFESVAVLQSDRDREVRYAVKIVGGAVERIDDPGVFGAGERLAVFLAEDAVIRIRLVQYVDDRVFGVAIDIGNEIVALPSRRCSACRRDPSRAP